MKSLPSRVVTHYANVRPSSRNWRRAVLGPFAKLFIPADATPPEDPTFGVRTFEECVEILSEFRETLARVVATPRSQITRRSELAREIFNKARLLPEDFLWGSNGCLLVVWKTATNSFREMLYGHLAHALFKTPAARIHRCRQCDRLFFADTHRARRFCSQRCKSLLLSRRYQSRHRARYRTYHRQLMRRLREEKES